MKWISVESFKLLGPFLRESFPKSTFFRYFHSWILYNINKNLGSNIIWNMVSADPTGYPHQISRQLIFCSRLSKDLHALSSFLHPHFSPCAEFHREITGKKGKVFQKRIHQGLTFLIPFSVYLPITRFTLTLICSIW